MPWVPNFGPVTATHGQHFTKQLPKVLKTMGLVAAGCAKARLKEAFCSATKTTKTTKISKIASRIGEWSTSHQMTIRTAQVDWQLGPTISSWQFHWWMIRVPMNWQLGLPKLPHESLRIHYPQHLHNVLRVLLDRSSRSWRAVAPWIFTKRYQIWSESKHKETVLDQFWMQKCNESLQVLWFFPSEWLGSQEASGSSCSRDERITSASPAHLAYPYYPYDPWCIGKKSIPDGGIPIRSMVKSTKVGSAHAVPQRNHWLTTARLAATTPRGSHLVKIWSRVPTTPEKLP